MKNIQFIFIGILFGIVMTKSEVSSWFRIQEMFRFDSFHMYGVIGAAFFFSAIIQFVVKKKSLKDFFGNPIQIKDKPANYIAAIIGGTLFGLGWAFTGACPGPLYTLLGHGYIMILLVIFGALSGAFLYGVLRSKLPH